jgi:hypothetical protein
VNPGPRRPLSHPQELSTGVKNSHLLSLSLVLECFCGTSFKPTKEISTMEWTTPQHEEICLNCEISSYANAEL